MKINKLPATVLFFMTACCLLASITLGSHSSEANCEALTRYLRRQGVEVCAASFTEQTATRHRYVYRSSEPVMLNDKPVMLWEIQLVDLMPGRYFRIIKPLEEEGQLLL